MNRDETGGLRFSVSKTAAGASIWLACGDGCAILSTKKLDRGYCMRGLIAFLLPRLCLCGQDSLKRAEELYQRTDYKASLTLLREVSPPTGAVYCLMGQDYFML